MNKEVKRITAPDIREAVKMARVIFDAGTDEWVFVNVCAIPFYEYDLLLHRSGRGLRIGGNESMEAILESLTKDWKVEREAER